MVIVKVLGKSDHEGSPQTVETQCNLSDCGYVWAFPDFYLSRTHRFTSILFLGGGVEWVGVGVGVLKTKVKFEKYVCA